MNVVSTVSEESINFEQEEHSAPDHLEPNDLDDLLPESCTVTDLMQHMPGLEETTVQAAEFSAKPQLVSEPSVEMKFESHELLDAAGEGLKPDHGSVAITQHEQCIEIWEPFRDDVLTGRGASINLHPGNQKFRALCYAHKAVFDVASHAAKKRIATEIWTTCQTLYNSRFLSKQSTRSSTNGSWIQQSAQSAILKAAQTIRDYQRPDRIVQRQILRNATIPITTSTETANNSYCCDGTTGSSGDGTLPIPPIVSGKKRRAAKSATPMDNVAISQPPPIPIYENPDGVDTNDVLCGRGAFVNGHYGNKYLRELAMARKADFDAGRFLEKRELAKEIVCIIQQLHPPGRFLQYVKTKSNTSTKSDTESNVALPLCESNWEEVHFDKAIMKACQVMRDIDRPDRKHRNERKIARMSRLQAINVLLINSTEKFDGNHSDGRTSDDTPTNHQQESHYDIIVGSNDDNGNNIKLQQHQDGIREEV